MTKENVPRLGVRACVAVLVLALVTRLAAIAATGFSTVEFGDARAYLFAARSLVETGRYPSRTDSFFFRAPGYPAFLVLCTLGHPSWIPVEKGANALAGASSSLLLAALSAAIFRNRVLAAATGLAAGLNPSFVLAARDIQSESLFLLLLLGAGYFLLAAADRPSTGLALAAGLLLALAALTRPSALALSPLLAGPLLDRRHPLRVRAHIVTAAALGFALALAPWTLRNEIVFHELISVSDSFGATFFDGNSVWADRYYGLRSRSDYELWLAAMDRDKARRLAILDPAGMLSPAARSRAFVRMAIEDRRQDSAATARLFAHKAWQWLRPYPTVWYWPRPVVAAVGVYYAALCAAAAAGLLRARRRGVALFCLCLLAITAAVHVAILPAWRYRVPYWDPVLLLYGVFGALILSRKTDGALALSARRTSWSCDA